MSATPEEIAHWRTVIQEEDQRRRGIDVSYQRTNPDGTTLHMNIPNATPEQAALVAWLQAEDNWKADAARRERQRAAELKQQREAQEQIEKMHRSLAEHEILLASATGFQRAMLERHAPTESYLDYKTGKLSCRTCTDREWEPESLDFPCDEYEFTRDYS